MPSVHPQEFIAMIDNVDPSLKPLLLETFQPKGTCRVATSPNFVFIVCNALRGLPPDEINKILETDKREFIPVNVIRDYITAYIPPQLTRQNMMMRWLQRSGPIDEVQIMETLVKLQLQRIINKMDKTPADFDDGEASRREMDLLQKMTMNSLEAKLKSGRVVQPPQQVQVNVTEQSTQTVHHEHTHSVEGLDPRGAAKVLKALEKVRKMTKPTTPEPEPEDGPTKH